MAYGTYDRFVIDTASDDSGLGTAANFADAANTTPILSKVVVEPRTVSRFGIRVVTALDYHTANVAMILTCYKYPANISANKVALGDLTVPAAGLAANSVAFVDVENKPVKAQAPYTGLAGYGTADLLPGDVVGVEISQTGTGGANLTGTFYPWVGLVQKAEVVGNENLRVNLTPAVTSSATDRIAAAEVDEPLA